ncbi:MAG: DoxX family protein [Gemmataceae bacterium]|nr:DoxX family protein [Gemmataceae bacterium]
MTRAALQDTIMPLALRVALAAVFIFHGWGKVMTEGNEMGAAWAAKMPEPPPRELQQAVAWGELAGGVALALGLLTRLAALGIVVVMVGAIVNVHGEKGFSMMNGGYEYNFVLIAIGVALIAGGGGAWALDAFFRRKQKVAS